MGLLGGHDNVVLETGAIRRFNGRTVFFVVLMCFGSMTYGYSAGITGSILGQPSFLEYMGLLTSSNANALIGAMNGLYYTGGFFGVVTNGWFVDRFGRKASITFGALLVLVASALLAGSVDMGMFIAFRFVSGFGAYILVMTVPVWISETVPPGLRGSFSLCHGICINAGYLIASYCSFGFYIHVHGGLSVWRGPMAVGIVSSSHPRIRPGWHLYASFIPNRSLCHFSGHAGGYRCVCLDMQHAASLQKEYSHEGGLMQDGHHPSGTFKPTLSLKPT